MEKFWHKMDENNPPPDYDDLLIMTTKGCRFIGFYCEETDFFIVIDTIDCRKLPKERVKCWAVIPHYFESKTQTNRQWLASLSDEELVSWLCDDEIIDYNNVDENGICRMEQPSPKLTTLKLASTSSRSAVESWLQAEHKE